MQAGSPKILRHVTFAVAFLLLGALFLVAASVFNKANALGPSEWETVRGQVAGYIAGQYQPGDDGEAGFVMSPAALKSRLDSNGDNIYLGEGDDAALAPVLVDVYSSSTWIPRTSYRTAWTVAADAGNASALKGWVQKRAAAGFNYDLVTYCLTGHTESPAVAAFGVMAQAGYFGTASPPKSYALKWGRSGWNTGTASYGNTKPVTAATAPGASSSTPAGSAACAGKTPSSELTRCVAAEALKAIDANAGGGAGVEPWASGSDASYAPVDLRSSLGSGTLAMQSGGGAYAANLPLDQLFTSTENLNKLYASGKLNIFVNRTQHTAMIAATAAQMLGYPSEGLKWGLPRWNNTLDEKFPGGAGYPLVSAAIDVTAPALTTGPIVSDLSTTTATIVWTTNEPATSVVEYSSTPGGPYTRATTGCENAGAPETCTTLRTSHTAKLTGLNEGATYYYRVLSYDGMANAGAPSAEDEFTTVPANCLPAKPALLIQKQSVYWGTYGDYVNRRLSVDYSVANSGSETAYSVKVVDATATNEVKNQTALPVLLGKIPGGSSALVSLKYKVPAQALAFEAAIFVIAKDPCFNAYDYEGQASIEVPLLPL